MSAKSEATSEQWSAFLRKCLRERLPSDRFRQFAKLLDGKSHASSREICRALLQPQLGVKVAVDPLVAAYASHLLRLGLVQGHDLLTVLLENSKLSVNAPGDANGTNGDAGVQKHASPELEEAILGLLIAQYAAQELPKSNAEAAKTLIAAVDWMGALVESDHRAMMQNMSGDFQTLEPGVVALREAVGRLFVALAENSRVVHVLNSSAPPEAAKKLADKLPTFIPLLSSVSVPLSNRLDMFQRSHDVLQRQEPTGFGGTAPNNVDVGEMQVQNVAERPIAHSRASMPVYLDALLSDLPSINDGVIVSHLQVRFKGDMESAIIDLITSSFELLAMVSVRGDSPDKTFLYRTFIVNKVPILLSNLSRMAFMPPNATDLIQQSFNRLSSNGFPSYDSGFGVGPNSSTLTDTRRQFLTSCAVHGHITKDSIQSIISREEPAAELPSRGKLTKETLVAEFQSNPQKPEQLISCLESMDGNAGASAEAMVQILHNLYNARDTMTLKSLCHLLAPKPHALDAMFLFGSPMSILSPICDMLDKWKYEEDQGEYQPVYEEFSSCLIFLLACVHRFNLNASALGSHSENGFVAWVMDQSSAAQPIKDLSEEQIKQLAGWARGLFELEGISDDVMSICPPQDFYKLVPTIFTQSLLARRLEAITLKALESGIELLLEIFLLPCMVFGVHCLSNQAWAGGGGVSAMLQFMQKLIRPSSKTGEAVALHNTVLSILKPNLKSILTELRQNDSSKALEIDSLLETLKQHSDYYRSPPAQLKDSGSWTSGQTSNNLFEFRDMFDTLCSWSVPAGLMPSIPHYSYQQIWRTVQSCGATNALQSIIESLIAHVETGVGDIALDIAASVICAADDAASNSTGSANAHSSLTLSQALQLARDEAPKTITKEPLKAEMIVLLHRHVEATLTSAPAQDMQQQINMQSMQMDMELNQGIGDLDMQQNLNLDMSQNMNVDMPQNMNVDMTTMNMDLDMNAVMSMDNMGMGQGQEGMDLTQTTQAMDFGSGDAAGGGAVSSMENPFPLEIDTSFGGQDAGQGEGGDNEMDDDGRRGSVEDIWSGLGLDFT